MPEGGGGGEEKKTYYEITTTELKMIHDYSGLSFNEIYELDCITYRLLLRDSIIHGLQQSDEGREYLEKCWILSQSKPDYKKLKEIKEKQDA